MKEITGNIWDYYGKEDTFIGITTNGVIRKDGKAVMGRGIALEAREKFPGIDKQLADSITANGGNRVFYDWSKLLFFFPTKEHWRDQASISRIMISVDQLLNIANMCKPYTFILPRPGCGNGWLTWEDVKIHLEKLPDNVWIISKEKE